MTSREDLRDAIRSLICRHGEIPHETLNGCLIIACPGCGEHMRVERDARWVYHFCEKTGRGCRARFRIDRDFQGYELASGERIGTEGFEHGG